MQICRVALLLLSLGAVVGRRIRAKQNDISADGGKTCRVTENDHSLKFGIQGTFRVKSCLYCKFHHFLTKTMSEDAIGEPELSEDKRHCKCFTSPKFWEAHGLEKKFWFQHYHQNPNQACTKHDCKRVFETWANMFNKKIAYPKAEQRMPSNKMIDSQENYDLHCDESTPEGLTLPSPADKILHLRAQIVRCTDPDEKLKLQLALDELLQDKAVEVFAYAIDEDWGATEYDINAAATGTEEHDDLHTFFLKPCMSSTGTEVSNLHEIFELCGMPEVGVSMKPGQWKAAYDMEADWGPERECIASTYECQLIQSIVEEEKKLDAQILSFRLKPCKSANGEETSSLDEIFKVCGNPSISHHDADGIFTLLPVKIDVSRQYDQAAELSDGMKFPCGQ